MKTEIRFLEELEEDLLEAARLEIDGADEGRQASRPSGPRRRPGARRRPRARILALAAAAFVLLAGTIGYLATRSNGLATRQSQAVILREPRIAAGPSHAPFGRFVPPNPRAAASPAPAGAPAPDQGSGGVPLTGPLIVKSAHLSLTVPRGTFSTRFAQAASVASRFGGFVDSTSSGGTQDHSGEVTIRVPAERFDQALAALRPLGRVDAQTISGKDVTAQYVDLNARLATWKAQEAALIRLMARAASVDDTLRVQTQLQRVQLTIEQLRGQIRLLNDQTANATITVSLAEAGTPTPSAEKVTNPSLGQGWRHAIAGFFGVLFAVVVGAGYVLPIAAFAVVVWLVIRWARRRTAAGLA